MKRDPNTSMAGESHFSEWCSSSRFLTCCTIYRYSTSSKDSIYNLDSTPLMINLLLVAVRGPRVLCARSSCFPVKSPHDEGLPSRGVELRCIHVIIKVLDF